MDYTGIIIEESLKDSSVLRAVQIVDTKTEQVTKQHNTPWLTQWTLHTVTIPASKAAMVAQWLSESLGRNYWYADYRNRTTHYIIFPGKVYKVDRSEPEQYEAVKAYGLSLGIPEHQLTFSSEITDP